MKRKNPVDIAKDRVAEADSAMMKRMPPDFQGMHKKKPKPKPKA